MHALILTINKKALLAHYNQVGGWKRLLFCERLIEMIKQFKVLQSTQQVLPTIAIPQSIFHSLEKGWIFAGWKIFTPRWDISSNPLIVLRQVTRILDTFGSAAISGAARLPVERAIRNPNVESSVAPAVCCPNESRRLPLHQP